MRPKGRIFFCSVELSLANVNQFKVVEGKTFMYFCSKQMWDF